MNCPIPVILIDDKSLAEDQNKGKKVSLPKVITRDFIEKVNKILKFKFPMFLQYVEDKFLGSEKNSSVLNNLLSQLTSFGPAYALVSEFWPEYLDECGLKIIFKLAKSRQEKIKIFRELYRKPLPKIFYLNCIISNVENLSDFNNLILEFWTQLEGKYNFFTLGYLLNVLLININSVEWDPLDNIFSVLKMFKNVEWKMQTSAERNIINFINSHWDKFKLDIKNYIRENNVVQLNFLLYKI